MINVSDKIKALKDAQGKCGRAHDEALLMQKNCTTCTRLHDSAECLECQASATDDNLYPMWRGDDVDAVIEVIEEFRKKTDDAPSANLNHRSVVHRMLDKIEQVYNANKKPA